MIKVDRVPSLELAKKDAIDVAIDFRYPEEIIKSIREAKSINEINRIMLDARRYI